MSKQPKDRATGSADRPATTGRPTRPALKAGLRRLWRDTSVLQIGVGAPHAVVLDGVREADRRLLEALDGRTPIGRLRGHLEVIDHLDDFDLLDDVAVRSPALRRLPEPARARLEPDLAAWALRGPPGHAARTYQRRSTATVEVRGAGRVGSLIAVLLASAGIGTVSVVDPRGQRSVDVPAPLATRLPPEPPAAPATAADQDAPADPDAPAEQATPVPTRAEQTAQWCTAVTGTGPRRRAGRKGAEKAPDVVVLCPVATCGAVDPEEHGSLLRTDTAHLVAYVRESAGVVGPFVLPGRGPCLRCVELARTDRDHAWPRLLAQLVAAPAAGRTEPVDACDGVLATLVSAHAALEVLAFIDGRTPTTWSVGHEMRAEDPLVRLRPWAQHPACGCAWDPTAEQTASAARPAQSSGTGGSSPASTASTAAP